MFDQKTSAMSFFMFIPDLPDSVKHKFPKSTLPDIFEYYHFHSSLIVNLWQPLMSLIALLTLIGFIALLEKATKKYQRFNWYIKAIKPAIKWNFFMLLFCSTYGDISLCSALEFKYDRLHSFLSVLSFLVSIVINIFCLVASITILYVNSELISSRKGVHITEQEVRFKAIEKEWEKYRVFFDDFRQESFQKQIFVFYFIARAYFINATLGYLSAYPLLQAIVITVLGVIMLLYLLISWPMKRILNQAQQLTYEVILLMLDICTLILTVFDVFGIDNEKASVRLGNIIIAINMVMRILPSFFIAIKVLLALIECWKRRKTIRVIPLSQSSRSLSQTISRHPTTLPSLVMARKPKIDKDQSVIKIEEGDDSASKSQWLANRHNLNDSNFLANVSTDYIAKKATVKVSMSKSWRNSSAKSKKLVAIFVHKN